jgi:hypothetical protein
VGAAAPGGPHPHSYARTESETARVCACRPFSRRKNPHKDSAPYNPEEWTVTLFAVPVATVIAGFLAW